MNGVLLINKDKGKTSRDMVNDINHIFDMKKTGHTGTLDPIATGVLIIVLGRYTKLVEELSAFRKEYIATIKLGIRTDTLDITGNILEERKESVYEKYIKEVLSSFKGKYTQQIPLYSAKKINGKKLYEYARNGEKVVLPKNEVEIFSIKFISFKEDKITFKCEVSKGTYIRSLIQSICEKLGVIGCMSNLIRTKQGSFSIEDSYTINDIKNGNYKLLKCEDLFNFPVINLKDSEYEKVKNGNKILLDKNDEKILLKYQDKEVAIYIKEMDYYIPYIMLNI